MKSTFIILSINVIFVLVFSKSLKNFEEMKKCEKSFKKIQKFRFLDKSEDEPSDWNSESEIESESESAESENESESAESEIESESAESEIESESAESENESESAESENESESAQSEIESESAESESESESKAESESESESKAESESESEFSGNQTVDEPEITVPITAPSTLPQPNRDAQVSIIGYNNFIFQENSISNYLIMFVLRIFFNGLPEPPRKVTMTLIVASTSTSLRLLEKQDNKDVEAECLIIEDNKEGTRKYNCSAESDKKPEAVGSRSNFQFYEREDSKDAMKGFEKDNLVITAQAYEDATNLKAVKNATNFVTLNGEVNNKYNSFVISGSLKGDDAAKKQLVSNAKEICFTFFDNSSTSPLKERMRIMNCTVTNNEEEKYEITCKPDTDFQGNIHQASGNFYDTSVTLNMTEGKDSVMINIKDDNPNKAYFRKKSSGLSGGAIAGIVIGLVAALIIFAIIALYLKDPNTPNINYASVQGLSSTDNLKE